MSCITCSVADHHLWYHLRFNPHLQNTMQMSSSSFTHHSIPLSQSAILPSKFSLETYKSICPWKQIGREVGRLSLDFYFCFSPPNPISPGLWKIACCGLSYSTTIPSSMFFSLLWVQSGLFF